MTIMASVFIYPGHRDVYLIFKGLNMNNDGALTLDEFYKIYEAVSIQWMVI